MLSTRGNALFLILIAVALFAALSYAVTNSGRGGGSVDREQAEIAAAEIIQFTSAIRQGIQRLQLINGCDDRNLNFDNAIETGYTNTSAPSDGRCNVFSPEGAGLSFSPPPQATGTVEPYYITPTRIDQIGTNEIDIIIALPIANKSVCDALNRNLDLPTDSLGVDRITRTTYFEGVKYKGSFSSNHNGLVSGGNQTDFDGQYDACLESDTSDGTFYPGNLGIGYFFYAVIVER